MNKKILVVDDSTTIRQMVSFALRGTSYDVVLALKDIPQAMLSAARQFQGRAQMV